MKIKEAFKKLDTYNELAELMNGDKMHVYFAEVTSGIGFGESFKSFADFRKYIRNEYFKEIADRILDDDGWELNGENELSGFAGRFSDLVLKFELDLSWN